MSKKAKLDPLILELIAKAEAYVKDRKIELTTLATNVLNDGSFFDRIADPKKTCTIKSYRRVLDHITVDEVP